MNERLVSRDGRRVRIMAALLNGASYDEIAAVEKITPERVREIIFDTLQHGEIARTDYRRLQMARLDPALKLALEAIEEGRIEAIDRLLRVMGLQDKYQAQAPAGVGGQDIRRRLWEKIEAACRDPDPRAMNKPAFEPLRGGGPEAEEIFASMQAEAEAENAGDAGAAEE